MKITRNFKLAAKNGNLEQWDAAFGFLVVIAMCEHFKLADRCKFGPRVMVLPLSKE